MVLCTFHEFGGRLNVCHEVHRDGMTRVGWGEGCPGELEERTELVVDWHGNSVSLRPLFRVFAAQKPHGLREPSHRAGEAEEREDEVCRSGAMPAFGVRCYASAV